VLVVMRSFRHKTTVNESWIRRDGMRKSTDDRRPDSP
jgi:hypothetical protein